MRTTSPALRLMRPTTALLLYWWFAMTSAAVGANGSTTGSGGSSGAIVAKTAPTPNTTTATVPATPTIISGCNGKITVFTSEIYAENCQPISPEVGRDEHHANVSSKMQFMVKPNGNVTFDVNQSVTTLEELSFESEAGLPGHLTVQNLISVKTLSILTLNKVAFEPSKLTLQVPSSLRSLTVLNTNAEDIILESDSFGLTNVILSNNTLSKIPTFLYSIQNNVKFTLECNVNSSTPQPLTAQQIQRLRANVQNFGSFFSEDCSTNPRPVCLKQVKDGTVAPKAGDTAHSSRGNSTDSPKPTSNGSTTFLIVVIAVVAVVGVVLGAVFTRQYLSRRTLTTSPTNDPSVGLIDKEDTPPSEPMAAMGNDDVLKQLHLPLHSVSLTKSVGTGRLWLGEYESKKVIIRRVENEAHDKQITQALVTQARMLAPLSHSNLSTLLGVTWFQVFDFGIVSEFVNRGTLKTVLMDAECSLDLVAKLRMCLDVAQGLTYLHANPARMYLQRLSSHRVLVTRELVCKLNIFDCVSHDTPLSVPEQFGTGELAWWAPELITNRHTSDPCAANVFSLGVVMGEILTRVQPYSTLTEHVGHTMADVQLQARVQRHEPLFPHEHHEDFESAPSEVKELIGQCLSSKPQQRPSAADVVAVLQTVIRSAERDRSSSQQEEGQQVQEA